MTRQFLISIFFIMVYSKCLSQGIIGIDSVIQNKITATDLRPLYQKRAQLIKEGFIFTSLDSQQRTNKEFAQWQLAPFDQYDSLILELIVAQNQKEVYIIKGRDFSNLQTKLDEVFNSKVQNGYLRSYYQFDTLTIIQNKVLVTYRLILGKQYGIDSLIIHHSNATKDFTFINKQIQKYFRQSGKKDWKAVTNQLKYIEFLEMDKRPDFSINDSNAILNIYLKERKVNQFSAILGILPNAYNSSELEITGDAKLSLNNLFNQGITFDLNWQKNLTNSQFLYTKFNVPFIFNTKLGIGGSFNLEKFDTSFLRVQYQLGLNLNIQLNQVLSFFYRKNSCAIIGLNKIEVLNGNLPSYLDFHTDEFGMGYKIYRLNQPFFTKKGWSLEANFLAGGKTISVNSRIAELKDNNGLSLARLYEGTPLSQLMMSFLIDFNKYTSLNQNFVLNTRFNSRIWVSETNSIGELYYIGGNRFLRGFDDNSFIVPWFICFSNELQYYLSEYFYSNIFVDVAPMKNQFNNTTTIPVGFGCGLSFRTSDNIFRMNVGSGYQEGNKFSFNSIKVHLSYISVF